MVPQTYNIHIMRGEKIKLEIGYNIDVSGDNLFACIRLHPNDEQYVKKFDIGVNKDNLIDGDAVEIKLSAETDNLNINNAYYDLFVWEDGKPSKCLVKGKIYIHNSISNRGK